MTEVIITSTGGDDTAAILAACATATPADRIKITGQSGITQTISPPCPLVGNHRLISALFALPGTAAMPMVNFLDTSGSGASDLTFRGNDTYLNNGGSIGAIQFGGNTVEVRDFALRRCGFEKFKNDYWVEGLARFNTYDTVIDECHFSTTAADVLSTGGTNYLVGLSGTMTGAFVNTRIQRNTIDGTGVCCGFTLFGQHRGFDISHNVIRQMGRSVTLPNPLGGMNCYPIIAYANGPDFGLNAPAQCVIQGNQIYDPVSCGMYFVRASGVLVAGNNISGQTPVDLLLPRGGIVMNGCTEAYVLGNILQDCQCGVNISSPLSSDIFVSGNKIKSNYSTPIGIAMDSTIGTNARVSITNNDTFLYSGSGKAFANTMTGGNIVIRNNQARAAMAGISDMHTATQEIGNNIFFPL